MLEKPDLQDELLITHLYDGYRLHVTQLAFLPLGADVNTAVYRVGAGDGSAYFLKLRRGPFDEMSVAIPGFLGDQGIGQIIPPIRTTTGQLRSSLEPYTLTLYPFVDGSDGYELDLSQRQWVELGAALRLIHTANMPAALRRALPRETYSPRWREQVRTFQSRLRAGAFDDPVVAELATLLQAQAAMIDGLVEAAERLGRALQSRPQEWTLCHADIHAGNILIGKYGSLYLVDWDTVLLAPKERDLMFVGSGLGPGWNQARETGWFYQVYGPAEIDPVALAYYRCERVVEDIAAFCEEILEVTARGRDRRRSLRYLASQFQANGVVEIALQSYQAAEVASRP